ncbi:hypothetical protein SH2C18_03810 [Clostridium sediminicola]|uniref:hypothetical protein n=1 Tax=Clostridium sediminicola TaxID=3114879 RepID=UPI0031F1C6D1
MAALILVILSLIIIVYGILIFLGKKFIIPRAIERLYWVLWAWTSVITTSISDGPIGIVILIIASFIVILYAVESEKNKFIICNIGTERIIEIIQNYLKLKRVNTIKEDNRVILLNRYIGEINIEYYSEGTLIDLGMIKKRKLRGDLLRNIKAQLNKIKREKYSYHGILYLIIGFIGILLFRVKALKYLMVLIATFISNNCP